MIVENRKKWAMITTFFHTCTMHCFHLRIKYLFSCIIQGYSTGLHNQP